MTNPPTGDDAADRAVRDALRRSLAEHAADAPSGPAVAEQILAAVDRVQQPSFAPHRRRPSRGWAPAPWLAVAAVLAVLVGVVVAAVVAGSGPDRHQAARSSTGGPPHSSSAPAPSTTGSGTHGTGSSSPANTSSHVVPPSTLSGVHVLDVTFTGADSGWALASADCLLSQGRCTALLRTTDGAVWTSHPNTPFNVAGVQGCAAPCVQHIRFATDRIGYAYGPSALYLTTDGATTWRPLSGGADALETLDRTVIRVASKAGCAPGCRYTVQTSTIGSTAWTSVRLPGEDARGDGVTLTRTGSTAYLQAFGDPAGGSPATSTLWTSTDDGAHWTARGEPCAARGGETDGTALTSAADGAAVVLCRVRTTGRAFVTVSTDRGQSFHAGSALLGASATGGLGAASADTVLVARGATYRTTDGGDRFQRLGSAGSTTPGNPGYLGFASADTGHAVSSDGKTIWTTHDAGLTWMPVTFG